MSRRINRDVQRFREIGEERRMDLKEFIKKSHLGDDIRVPIKRIDIPRFEYSDLHAGGIGKGEGEVGDPVDEDGDDDEPGEETDDHGYYDMSPEEFAEELDEELGLDFEKKGSSVVEEELGDFNKTMRSGPNSTLDKHYFFTQAIKRKVAKYYDEDFVKDLLRVKGYGVENGWRWCLENNINISKSDVQKLYEEIEDKQKYDSIDEIGSPSRKPPADSYNNMRFRKNDERYRAPETVEKPDYNAVVFNIRDVSGSMREDKRELVERVFTPLDWYLQGKYDNIDFRYIAHDVEAWEVDREKFFGIKSGGGTKISSAFELLQEELLPEYPANSWNRFIFLGGDGENRSVDTKQRLIPMMNNIEANQIAYVQTQPNGRSASANLADKLETEFREDDKFSVSKVNSEKDIIEAITNILGGDNNE